MFCQKCGASVNEGTAFCPNCGAAIEAQPQPQPQVQPQWQPQPQPMPVDPSQFPVQKGNILGLIFAIISLVLALLSFPIGYGQLGKLGNVFDVFKYGLDGYLKNSLLAATLIFLIFNIAAVVFASIAKKKCAVPYGYRRDGMGIATKVLATIALPHAIIGIVTGSFLLIAYIVVVTKGKAFENSLNSIW